MSLEGCLLVGGRILAITILYPLFALIRLIAGRQTLPPELGPSLAHDLRSARLLESDDDGLYSQLSTRLLVALQGRGRISETEARGVLKEAVSQLDGARVSPLGLRIGARLVRNRVISGRME